MARTNAAAALCLVSTRLALRHGLILLEMPALPGDCVIRSLLAFLIAIRIHTCLRHDRLRCWALRPRMLRLLGMPGAHNSSETHSAAICVSTYVHLQALLSRPVNSIRFRSELSVTHGNQHTGEHDHA